MVPICRNKGITSHPIPTQIVVMKLLTVVLTTELKSDARITTRQSHVIPLFRQMLR